MLVKNEPKNLAAIISHAGRSSVVSRRGRAALWLRWSDHRDCLADGVSLGLVIGCESPYFGGAPESSLVDSQVSP